jgi:acyl-coenzyme A thioesterase PaaI-like protein
MPNPPDPDFEKRVRASFSQVNMLAAFGAEITRVRAGEVHIHAPFDDRFTQQDGFLHAGTVAMLMDSACGFAAFSLMPAGVTGSCARSRAIRMLTRIPSNLRLPVSLRVLFVSQAMPGQESSSPRVRN